MRVGRNRSSSRPPMTRPVTMPAISVDTAAVATPGDTPAWARSTSLPHSVRQTSTEPVANRLVAASQ